MCRRHISNMRGRLYVNTAYPSVSYLLLPCYPYHRKSMSAPIFYDNIRSLLTDPASPLFQLFVPEWTARIADALEAFVGEDLSRIYTQTIDLLSCLGPDQESQRPDMLITPNHTNMRTFWLPANSQGERVGVCVATDGAPLLGTSPFDQLFKMSGLLFPAEVVAAPRDYYELEKVPGNEYRLTRKEQPPPSSWATSESEPAVGKQFGLPLELWHDILRLAVAPEDKMALIPTMLWMRLVNRAWNEIATSLYHTLVEIPTSRIHSLVYYPAALRPYLRRLRIHVDELIPVRRPSAHATMSAFLSRHPHTLEDSVVRIFTEFPHLNEITFAHATLIYIPAAHVVGWHREASESDVLEPALVAELDRHLFQLDQLTAKNATTLASITESTDRALYSRSHAIALANVFHSAPTRFHCLSPPGEALISALGRFFTMFIRCYKEIQLEMVEQHLKNVVIEFDVASEWGIEEAARWFEEGKPWVRGGWPEDVLVSVCGWDEEKVAIMPVRVEGSGRQLFWQHRRGVLMMTW